MIIDMPNTRTREIAHKIEQLHEERGESATGRVRFAFAGLIGRIGIRYYGNHAARVLTAGRVRDFQRML